MAKEKSKSSGLTEAWYKGAWWLYLLAPLSLLYYLISVLRRFLYTSSLLKSHQATVPVVVVGNISIGGTGKSPLTSGLIKFLRSKGYSPGIASRGYGAKISGDEVREVRLDSLANEVGDEPLMLKQMLDCPVFVSPTRSLAVDKIQRSGCDVVLCDDGLQHYALARDIEICVFDGERGLGNGWALPVGPLRELRRRIDSVDFVVVNGSRLLESVEHPQNYLMHLQASGIKPCANKDHDPQSIDGTERDSTERDSTELIDHSSFVAKHQKVHAVAGIGNPERFFRMLESWGFEIVRHPFEDHYQYSKGDFEFDESFPIMMTEKDAVKCSQLELRDAYYVPVNACLEEAFYEAFLHKLTHCKSRQA